MHRPSVAVESVQQHHRGPAGRTATQLGVPPARVYSKGGSGAIRIVLEYILRYPVPVVQHSTPRGIPRETLGEYNSSSSTNGG